jgi:hypothetical protein
MAAAVGTLQDPFAGRRRIPLRVLLSYVLALSIMLALVFTIRAVRPTISRSPASGPQAGPLIVLMEPTR